MLPAEAPVTLRRAPLPTLDDPCNKTRQFVISSIEFTAGHIDSRFGHDGSSAVEGVFRDRFIPAVGSSCLGNSIRGLRILCPKRRRWARGQNLGLADRGWALFLIEQLMRVYFQDLGKPLHDVKARAVG